MDGEYGALSYLFQHFVGKEFIKSKKFHKIIFFFRIEFLDSYQSIKSSSNLMKE